VEPAQTNYVREAKIACHPSTVPKHPFLLKGRQQPTVALIFIE